MNDVLRAFLLNFIHLTTLTVLLLLSLPHAIRIKALGNETWLKDKRDEVDSQLSLTTRSFSLVDRLCCQIYGVGCISLSCKTRTYSCFPFDGLPSDDLFLSSGGPSEE